MHVEKWINQGVVYATCTGDRYSLRMHVLKLLGPWNIESRILVEMSMLPLAKPQKKLVFFKLLNTQIGDYPHQVAVPITMRHTPSSPFSLR